MGGKNHQPCKHYLPDSTELSRDLSLAYAQLELANVALEDVLLAELRGETEDINKVIIGVNDSCASLDSALGRCSQLRSRMVELDFVDLPTLETTDLVELGNRLVDGNMVNHDAWRAVTEKIVNGFGSVLLMLENWIRNLKTRTTELVAATERLRDHAKQDVIRILEENRQGNIKVEFARLYCSWANFNQVFLASSLLSTELWYAYCGRNSLYPVAKEGRAVA